MRRGGQLETAVRRARLWFQEGNCLMSIKSKVLAAAATLTMVGGVAVTGALTAGTASAATPSCGTFCVNIFSKDFGTYRSPNFTVDVWRQGAKVGQPIILFKSSNSDPALDFVASVQGTVSDFCAAGIITNFTCYRWGGGSISGVGATADLPAFEIEYAPYGVQSGLCIGVPTTAFNNEKVSLAPCGVSSKTVWIVDALDSILGAHSGFYAPLINGSNTNFSHPYVLTYPKNGYPTDIPRPQLTVTNLTGFSQTVAPFLAIVGTIQSNQLWGATLGELK